MRARVPIEDAYRDDLAYIHDAGYGHVAADAATRLTEELNGVGFRDGTVVDLGCGNGILARDLVEAGFQVTGIDVSGAMVVLARMRAPNAEIAVGSFVTANLPACVAVTATGEVLNYAFDTANDTHARDRLFRRVYEALVPGGLWMFDVATLERTKLRGPQRTFAQGPDWAVLVETDADAATGMLTRRITSFRQVGGLYRRDDEVHRLALVDRAAVLRSLRTIGFNVQIISRYWGVALPQGGVAFLCSKPVAPAV